MKKNNFIFILMLLTGLFWSCSDDVSNSSDDGEALVNRGSLYLSAYKTIPQVATTRAAVHKNYVWDANEYTGRVYINILFRSNVDVTVSNKVMEYAKEWESCSGVQFIRLASNSYTTPDVIVDVEILENIEDKISWSYLGTDNRDVADEGNTSVKLILKSGELYTQNFKANVLMHFGHVLGLVYEYQRATSMLGLISVDRNALGNLVERFTQGLSGSELDGVEEIDYSSNSASKFVIKDEDGNTLDYSFDAKSIMLPYLGAGIITYSATGKDVITQANTTLSAQDKAYIAGVYPPMNGDAYTRGATSAIRLTISLPDHTFSDYAVAPYNFDTQTMGELGTSTVASYPTIGVGEYEWTASNLKYMYRTDKMHVS